MRNSSGELITLILQLSEDDAFRGGARRASTIDFGNRCVGQEAVGLETGVCGKRH